MNVAISEYNLLLTRLERIEREIAYLRHNTENYITYGAALEAPIYNISNKEICDESKVSYYSQLMKSLGTENGLRIIGMSYNNAILSISSNNLTDFYITIRIY